MLMFAFFLIKQFCEKVIFLNAPYYIIFPICANASLKHIPVCFKRANRIWKHERYEKRPSELFKFPLDLMRGSPSRCTNVKWQILQVQANTGVV